MARPNLSGLALAAIVLVACGPTALAPAASARWRIFAGGTGPFGRPP